eukprot:TRINITY_DN64103_c0_g1_i1.p1 TRINITY_DN64103_c0_g1~~TRINITY_DN64103_c0_g1_i1.p1  ORF type:complete len:297 (+),score=27.25 TRINITY_DN64103_c0_g1_i1:29-919(+)
MDSFSSSGKNARCLLFVCILVIFFVAILITSPDQIRPHMVSLQKDHMTRKLFVPVLHHCNESQKTSWKNIEANKTTRMRATERSLGIVHDVLAEFRLPTILEGGSVLGFIRECGVIRNDPDGDVAVLGQWFQGNRNVRNLTKAFAKRGVDLESSMCPHGPAMVGCELRATFQDRSYVDIFVYGTHKLCPEAPCTFFWSLWPGGTVGPFFHECVDHDIHFELVWFLNRTFWIPSPTSKYLEANYGTEWRKPGGSVYKTCDWRKERVPEPDVFALFTPPAEYVFSLETQVENSTVLGV